MLLALCGCARHAPAPGAEPPRDDAPLAALPLGEAPLWFELGPEGPRRIASPADASLEDFVPWPLSRRVAGLLPQDTLLTLVINRQGFLVLRPAADAALVMTLAFDPAWDTCVASAAFFVGETPAAFLSRDTFFSVGGQQVPDAPVRLLPPPGEEPRGIVPEALRAYPAAAGWEAAGLFPAPDGLWYLRVCRPGPTDDQGEQVFLRAASLEAPAAPISLGGWYAASAPEPLAAAPAPLARALAAAFAQAGSASFAELASPGASRRVFAPAAGPADAGSAGTGSADAGSAGAGSAGADMALSPLSGFFREGDSPLAFVILPDGRGFFTLAETPAAPFRFPPLPAGFCYTAAALAGPTLAAAWEEQTDAAVGAAGFVLIPAPWE
jgi:hypothetical protein